MRQRCWQHGDTHLASDQFCKKVQESSLLIHEPVQILRHNIDVHLLLAELAHPWLTAVRLLLTVSSGTIQAVLVLCVATVGGLAC